VRAELAAREPHPVDGRAAMLVLTDAGRDVVERATVALNAEVFENVGLDDGDAEELAGIIARMRKDAGDFTDPRPVPDPL
jgi:DNA-binding MarR family transcriptional regulator